MKNLKSNLNIRVTLQRATGKASLNKDDIALENTLLQTRTQKEIGLPLKPDREEIVISWQTKIFSKREFLRYTNPDYQPKNILEQHYVKECLDLK